LFLQLRGSIEVAVVSAATAAAAAAVVVVILPTDVPISLTRKTFWCYSNRVLNYNTLE
jgi:hypothetical protein